MLKVYSLVARQLSFARNGKSDGSDERQLYSQATKLTKKLLTALLCRDLVIVTIDI